MHTAQCREQGTQQHYRTIPYKRWGQENYRKSSEVNMPLALRSIESLLASYGCSLDGISSTAGMERLCASIACRIISAINWLISIMPISSR
ncbi:hypothetical protein GDO81_024400 [Engystomops pustulosus]|uniref:Uncharacterized protein n=1 Tax=Engystomops pustulosus TaxID=76066 RepID=A0AAV6YJ75_ENGPU|nr:hypothetical protein GDO81_024400 [Engystomops pustulosus]